MSSFCFSNINNVLSKESFVKFIQQRYGVNCYIINTLEDMQYAVDTGAGFSMEGIGNFDLDKERLSTIAMASIQSDPSMAKYYGFILNGE